MLLDVPRGGDIEDVGRLADNVGQEECKRNLRLEIKAIFLQLLVQNEEGKSMELVEKLIDGL